jgi:tRNA A-37 threonylcarbamoyl transferase component Bud32
MNNATQSFLGRYRLVKVLGQGAMGVVYEAVDTRLNRTVAIKTVLRSHLADETTATEYAARFEREAQAAARLAHPHVVTVYDFGEHEDISYIVMEFVRGRELNQAFEAGEKFALPESIRIMRELLAALDYAHQQGIVHRDIKPANVMLAAGNSVKLTDFGVARVANANQDRTMPGTLVGTPSYMSPEQILGMAVGSRTDIFAAGVILYQFLTGRRPFTGGGPFGVQRKIVQDEPDAPSRVNPEVPAGFDLIVSKALAKQPENRYESAAAFAADLERIGNTLQREVPLIDLDLGPAPPAPAAPAAAPAARAAAPAPDVALKLNTNVPVARPPAVRAPEPTMPPSDPEATVIMFRPSAPDATARPGAAAAPPVSPTAHAPTLPMHAPTVPMHAPTVPMTQPGPAAPAPARAAPAAPPAPRAAPAAPPRPAAAAAPPPRPASPAPAPARLASAPPQPYGPRRTLVPVAAGAGVAVLALTAWLLVARPWAAKPGDAAGKPTVVTEPAAGPGAAAPAPQAVTPPPAAAPEPPPAPAPTPAPTSAAETRPEAPAPTRPVVVEQPVPKPAVTRKPPAEPAAKPAPAPRGEPLTAEQTSYFQTRCTR